MSVTGKILRVGSADLYFADIAALEAGIDEIQRTLLDIEEGPLACNPRDLSAWREVELHAAMLLDLLAALDTWIDNDVADLDREIDAARQSIRKLGASTL